MNVLGIETSCDETAASVVADGRTVLSSVVFSQVALHQPYGGVVPEIASRHHVEHLPAVIERAVTESGVPWAQLDAVAVTYGPGLASSLLVGLAAAKALALRLDRPLIGINHLEAHLYSAFLAPAAPRFADACPLVALVVSGGHTMLLRVDALGQYRVLGSTRDDAAGEAFDKGAKLMGLPYPGGPSIDRAAEGGDPSRIRFPRGRPAPVDPGGGELAFSFSGLKTALLYYLRDHPQWAAAGETASIAASYQEAIVDALVDRVRRAVRREGASCLAAGGGVTLNRSLRARLAVLADELKVRLLLAPPAFCGDNAAMIAGLADTGCGVRGAAALELDVDPNLDMNGE